jgi:murein DD-endopeptidase MepM/ murein hydrolase activator NlpD
VRLLAAVLLLVLAGCTSESSTPPEPSAQVSPAPSEAGTATTAAPPSPTATGAASRTPSRTPTRAAAAPSRPADPRWRFFSADRRRHSSPWFPGRHRIMIPFGCTPAPYYSPDPSCPDGHGFHHGIDVAIPCGTPLRAGRAATALDPGALGPAYGDNPVLLRVGGRDVVIGHTRRVFVRPGEPVPRGRVFARVSDNGAPDGCHLHFEVRRPRGGVSDAVDPAPLLGLRP